MTVGWTILLRLAAVSLACAAAAPALAQDGGAKDGGAGPAARTVLTDAELAQVTGKFLLPNGVELAVSVTSDTAVNGQLVLRSVLTVDKTSTLQVFGRSPGAPAIPAAAASAVKAGAAGVAGIQVALDRQSGIQTITPTFTVSQAPSVSVGAAPAASAAGLTALPVTPGGAAVATADGSVTVQAVPSGGAQVMLEGDRLAVANLVGPSVATAVVNSANDRTLDTVTTVAVDLRNAAPYQIGAAQMRVDALAIAVGRVLGR